MSIYFLTCANEKEAKAISQTLLKAKLVACVRQWAVSSSYWWDGKINNDDEVILMMESVEAKFADIEKVVAGIHSYDEYVLTQVKVNKTTPGVHKWLEETLR